MAHKRVAVVGAGVIGCTIALAVARYGYNVLLKDVSIDVLEQAKKSIRLHHRTACMLNKSYAECDFPIVESRISFQNSYDNFDKVAFVIENITEYFPEKTKLYQELGQVCHEDTIYAINTSCISITKLAPFLPRPSNVIGAHFMNPATIKDLVEVIRGAVTSSQTEEKLLYFLKSIKKSGVVINDVPGFVSNRLSHLLMNEAAAIVQEKVATVKQVDTIMRQGFGHSMGPLETADLIGLDTVVNSLNILHESYHTEKYRCCPMLEKMVEAGYLGRKSGKGFYNY